MESVNAALGSPGARVEQEQGEATGFTVTEMVEASECSGRPHLILQELSRHPACSEVCPQDVPFIHSLCLHGHYFLGTFSLLGLCWLLGMRRVKRVHVLKIPGAWDNEQRLWLAWASPHFLPRCEVSKVGSEVRKGLRASFSWEGTAEGSQKRKPPEGATHLSRQRLVTGRLHSFSRISHPSLSLDKLDPELGQVLPFFGDHAAAG